MSPFTARIAVACVAALPLIAQAAETPSPAMEMLKAESFGLGNPLKAELPHAFTIAAMPIEIQKTELSAIEAKLGGKTSHSGDAGASLDWLCYASPAAADAPAMLVWFASNEMGGGTTLQQVAAEILPQTAPSECTPLKAPIGLKLGLPGIGTTKDELKTAYGSVVEEKGTIDYLYAADDAKTQISTQSYVNYKLGSDGKVIAVMTGWLQTN